MSQYLRLLTDLNFMTGLIGRFEYHERLEIADWMEDFSGCKPDPRVQRKGVAETAIEQSDNKGQDQRGVLGSTCELGANDPDWLELLMLNQWMFTIGDADCYPSVPHGHYKSKTKKWPKLNPYTGRVFSDTHREDSSMRLSKQEMIKLWSDSKFLEHCREQVIWYNNFAPEYGFPNARRGMLAFPRWRK